MGVSKRSTPSRKNGRFSGKSKAKRSLAEICASSDSICEKSGLMVASSALSAVGFHLTSMPASWPVSSSYSAPATGARRDWPLAVA